MLPSLLLMYLAYLARRPNTYHLRLMILPVALLVILRTYFGYMFSVVDRAGSNWALGMLPFEQVGSSLTGVYRLPCCRSILQSH